MDKFEYKKNRLLSFRSDDASGYLLIAVSDVESIELSPRDSRLNTKDGLRYKLTEPYQDIISKLHWEGFFAKGKLNV